MVGLSKNRFIDLTPDIICELSCGICNEILLNPVKIPCCKELYCKQCLTDWRLSNKVCVNRRHRLSPHLPANKPLKLVSEMLSELKIHCNYWKYGCEQVMSLEHCKSHSENCSFNPKRKLYSSDEQIDVKLKKRKRWSQSAIWTFR